MQLPNIQFPPSTWPGGRYSFLLCSLLALFAISSLLPNNWVAATLTDALMAVVFICGVMSLGSRQIAWLIAAIIFVPEIVGIALSWAFDAGDSLGSGIGATIRSAAVIVFCVYMTAHIFRDVTLAKRVTHDAICGALCVYLLLGLLWAFAYLLIAHHAPGSFNFGDRIVASVSPDDSKDMFSLMIYFSFVTLTTLGFGDISPVSPIARTACWMEAIIGQLFLATFVAGLVGMHIADRIERQKK